MRTRVAIARALALEPECCLGEPLPSLTRPRSTFYQLVLSLV